MKLPLIEVHAHDRKAHRILQSARSVTSIHFSLWRGR